MNIKKVIIMVCIVIFIVVLGGGLYIMKLASEDFAKNIIVKSEEENITTELGDEFIIGYVNGVTYNMTHGANGWSPKTYAELQNVWKIAKIEVQNDP